MDQMRRIRQLPYILVAVLAIIYIISVPFAAATEEFPERGDSHIVDPEQLFEAPQKNPHDQILQQLPHQYVIVFLESIEEEGFDYARALFDHYELDERSMLLVTEAGSVELYYAYGTELQEKGITDDLIESKKEDYYYPQANEGSELLAMNALIQSLEREIEIQSEQQERESQIVVTEQPEEDSIEEQKSTFPWWIKLLIALLLILILGFILSSLYRRTLIKKVDRLEDIKIELENRPFSNQLARIKDLKLAGETESKFDQWKAEWEGMLTTTLPDIEERLIDIEDDAYAYRFIRANKRLKATEDELLRIEESFYQIMYEVDQLTSSAKQNTENITLLHEQYQELKAILQKEAISLGISLPVWKEKFEKSTRWFEDVKLAQENGDVLTANDYIEAIEKVFGQVREGVEKTPDYLKELEQVIPRKIKEVEQAIHEMKEKGYALAHTKIDDMFEALKKEQHLATEYLQQGQLTKLEELIAAHHQKLEEMFAILENEVQHRQYVLQYIETIEQKVNEIDQKGQELKEIIERTKASYTWEEDWEELEIQINQQLAEWSEKRKELLDVDDIQDSYPQFKSKIESFEQTRQELLERMSTLEQVTSTVRQEELQAKEVVTHLKQALVKVKSIIRKSNLPGIPQHLETGLVLAEEHVRELTELFDEMPVDMMKVHHVQQEARTQVESVTEVARSVIEQANRAEWLMQFANRYRRHHPHILPHLEEAEKCFRQYQYRESLDYVESALDQADKSWRKQIEELEEMSS